MRKSDVHLATARRTGAALALAAALAISPPAAADEAPAQIAPQALEQIRLVLDHKEHLTTVQRKIDFHLQIAGRECRPCNGKRRCRLRLRFGANGLSPELKILA